MLLQTSGLVLVQSLQSIWFGVMSYLPAIIFALIIFVIGWVLAHLVGKSVKHLIDLSGIDRTLEKTGIQETFKKAGVRYSTGRIVGGIIKWFLIIVFLVAVFDILGLSELNAFLQSIVLYFLPNVLIAATIVLIASVVAKTAGRMVTASAKTAGLHSANFAGSLTKWAIWIFALLMALSQLGIAAQLVQTLFIAIVAMMALAGGLAFGLGGRDHASKVLSDVGRMISKED
jgi:small-conductance mechanosensitive channel